MSLLIKALQKAEQEKTADDKTSASDGGLSLGLAPVNSVLESDLDGEVGFSQPSVPPVQNQKQVNQQAAATMFAAKSISTNKAGLSKSALLAGAGLLSLLLLGGGFYFYLNSLNQPELVMPKPGPAISQSAISQPAVEAKVSGEVAPATDSTNLVSPVTEEANSTKDSSEVSAKVADKSPDAVANTMDESRLAKKERSVAPAPAPRKNSVKRSQQLAFGEPIEQGEDTTVKVTRNGPVSGINPGLLSAYAAFNAGDDVSAQRYYRQVLQGDIRNVDALLGMAAIASRQGRNNDALGWYGKVLEVEPRNTVAQAAMVSVMDQADPVGSESRIKNLLAQQPEAAHLHAALGNLYAEQNQWTSAQQAYFQALHFDANNAEYAFNLAVSLDHLGKTALALQYYKTTLELLPKSGAGRIDRAQVESRIAQLQ